MKALKLSVLIMIAAVVTFGLSGAAYAFHSGGVAECEGCHTMHNSLDGEPVWAASPVGVAGPFLLKGSDQSSACLNCHGPSRTGGYHILSTYQTGTGVSNYTPGGDFAWLTKTYSWIPRGTTVDYSYGYQHGHNVIALDYTLDVDPRFETTGSPGGGYPAGKAAAGTGSWSFGCHSCHDPHSKTRILSDGTVATTGEPIYSSGSYGADPTIIGGTGFAVGSYRLLGGVGYQPLSLPGVYQFTQPAMRAAAPSTYNAPDTDLNGIRTAYGSYSSDWCSNCHNSMHSILSTVPNANVHPTDEPLSALISNYNSYVKTGDMSGSPDTSYLSLVAFQSDNYGIVNSATANSTLAAIGATSNGPVVGDRVNCFSCHRAHASGWDSMTRYPLGSEFVTTADAAGNPVYSAEPKIGMGRTALEYQSAMNGRPATVFAAYQRVLCNKCHAKD